MLKLLTVFPVVGERITVARSKTAFMHCTYRILQCRETRHGSPHTSREWMKDDPSSRRLQSLLEQCTAALCPQLAVVYRARMRILGCRRLRRCTETTARDFCWWAPTRILSYTVFASVVRLTGSVTQSAACSQTWSEKAEIPSSGENTTRFHAANGYSWGRRSTSKQKPRWLR